MNSGRDGAKDTQTLSKNCKYLPSNIKSVHPNKIQLEEESYLLHAVFIELLVPRRSEKLTAKLQN